MALRDHSQNLWRRIRTGDFPLVLLLDCIHRCLRLFPAYARLKPPDDAYPGVAPGEETLHLWRHLRLHGHRKPQIDWPADPVAQEIPRHYADRKRDAVDGQRAAQNIAGASECALPIAVADRH